MWSYVFGNDPLSNYCQEEAMNKLGVYQFAQVASWTNDEIMWIDDSLSVKGRIERDDWGGQVSELIKG